MNSAASESGIESELINLDGVPFTKLRELTDESLHRSMHRVVEHTRCLRAPYRSASSTAGERID
jgi:hypothetical protein